MREGISTKGEVKAVNAIASSGLFERTGLQIDVSGLHKVYRVADHSFNALEGITCAMPLGRVTIIQGPSGCGKSTLLNIIGGVDQADKGQVRVGDRDITQVQLESALAEYRLLDVGFVFQSFNLIPGLTALRNLQLPMTAAGMSLREGEERGERLLELVGMATKRHKRPDELSGGEQQRVAVALALVNDPPVVLADEPTGNLDSNNALAVIDLLSSLAHELGKTIVISTHDPLVGARGDVRLHMRDGVLAEPH